MPTCSGSLRWKNTLGLLLNVGSALAYTAPSSVTPAHYTHVILILTGVGWQVVGWEVLTRRQKVQVGRVAVVVVQEGVRGVARGACERCVVQGGGRRI